MTELYRPKQEEINGEKEVLSDKQEYVITQNGNSLSNRSDEVQFNLGTASISNLFSNIVTAVDDPGNTRTKFIASTLCKIDMSWSFRASAGERAHLYKNGVIFVDADQNAAGESMSSSGFMILQAGEYFSVGSNAAVQSSAIPATLNFTAIAIKKIKDL